MNVSSYALKNLIVKGLDRWLEGDQGRKECGRML